MLRRGAERNALLQGLSGEGARESLCRQNTLLIPSKGDKKAPSPNTACSLLSSPKFRLCQNFVYARNVIQKYVIKSHKNMFYFENYFEPIL